MFATSDHPFRPRTPTSAEERANCVSHAIGFVVAAASLPLLVMSAVSRGTPGYAIGAIVFSLAVLLLYGASSLYHALPPTRAKDVMQVIDHAAIFVLIAGTYTPFALGALDGAWRWTILATAWGLGLLGIALKLLRGTRHPRLSLGLYLVTGWLALVAAKPLWLALSGWGVFWLVAGGVAYTAGVAFFVAEGVRFGHFVWHLFVMAGTTCHAVAVLLCPA
ncbi:MAG: hemolysin III family protein [Phycisphaerales bacterium]|nr:hemolysin III family protein [Phycisphaerales bacterium]